MNRPYQIEVVVDSVASAMWAEKLGADRVELCVDLHMDGLTPSMDLIRQCRAAIDIGLFVIIRPREGDFHYSTDEIEEMMKQINGAQTLGGDGIVSGALQADGHLDVETTRQLMTAAAPLPFTFHRAFDVCSEPLKTFAQLDGMGIDRLLTSGQGHKALDGLELIRTMCERQSDIQVMAGSGVNGDAVLPLWDAGVRQFHFTSHQLKDGVNIFDEGKMRGVVEQLKKVSA